MNQNSHINIFNINQLIKSYSNIYFEIWKTYYHFYDSDANKIFTIDDTMYYILMSCNRFLSYLAFRIFAKM